MFFRTSASQDCAIIEKNFNSASANFDDKNQYVECIYALYGMSTDQWEMYWAAVIGMLILTIIILFISRYAWEKGAEIGLKSLLVSYLFNLHDDDGYGHRRPPIRERIPKNLGFREYLFQNGVYVAVIDLLIVTIFGGFMYLSGLLLLSMVSALSALILLKTWGVQQFFEEQSTFAPDQYATSEAYCLAYQSNYVSHDISVQAKLLYQDCFNTLYPTISWFQFHHDQWLWLLFLAGCSFIFLSWRSRFNMKENMALTLFIGMIHFIFLYVISVLFRYVLFNEM